MVAPISALNEHAFCEPDAGDGTNETPRDPRKALSRALGAQLVTARELARRKADPVQVDVLPTGMEALDRLLSGGVPRGDVVEIRGARSSGRFSCVQALLATTIATGEVAALVDLGDQLSPDAARGHGIDLERLLWVRPRHLREALSAVEILLSSRFPLVVVDLGVPPIPGGRGAEASWLRLARAARRDAGALVVSSPYRVTGSAAGEVIDLARGTFRWRRTELSPVLPAGLTIHAERSKSRREPRAERADLSLWTPEEAGLYLGVASRQSPVAGPPVHPMAGPVPRRSLSRPRTVRSWGYRRPAIAQDVAESALGSIPTEGPSPDRPTDGGATTVLHVTRNP
jgi:hypothetical protein